MPVMRNIIQARQSFRSSLCHQLAITAPTRPAISNSNLSILNDWRAWMIFLITGMACSIYLTSMVSTYLGVTEPKIVAGIGFLLGAFGGSLLAAINRAIKSADLWALIRQRFGGGNPP